MYIHIRVYVHFISVCIEFVYRLIQLCDINSTCTCTHAHTDTYNMLQCVTIRCCGAQQSGSTSVDLSHLRGTATSKKRGPIIPHSSA